MNSGPRWLISITDMPLPRQSSISSAACRSTLSGSAAGPALKLKARVIERISSRGRVSPEHSEQRWPRRANGASIGTPHHTGDAMAKMGIDQEALVTMFTDATAQGSEQLRKSVGDATLAALQG